MASNSYYSVNSDPEMEEAGGVTSSKEMARRDSSPSTPLRTSWDQITPPGLPGSDVTTASTATYGTAATTDTDDEGRPLLSTRILERQKAKKRKLSMIFGVTIPCLLSIFSVILFLRLGFVLGQAGFWHTMLMIVVGYTIVILTVLSISAIATSDTVEGGGVYFMISRALGPEFGGSVGIIFFVANVFGSAAYIIGFVEALGSNLGTGGSLLPCGDSCGLPISPWPFNFLYGTVVLFFCLLVCLVGAGLFAKTTFIIFCAVMISLFSVMFSFGFEDERTVPFARDNPFFSANSTTVFNYTSWSWSTFRENFSPNYTADYSQSSSTHNVILSFQAVFAVMFNGCTGIMAGANISGDLKNPSVAIPQGTLLACALTFFIYIILFTFTAFTCSRDLLLNNYNYLQYINVVSALITVGVFASTLSAALSNLIGASRVLQALAKDRLFSGVLHPLTWTVGKKKEPLPAVLFSWFVVQLTLLLRKFNTIAPLVTMFFLLSYGVVNLACFALKFAAAPNFRPTFQVYARYTSAIGALGCVVLMFVIDPTYAAVTIVLMVLIFVYLLIRGPATPWGDVSQALIYHQVRKFLLRLDIKKRHVKFWRPEVLLMVGNPRSAFNLIEFTNDLKKGGLYVLGHVIQQPFCFESAQYHNDQLNTWLTFVEISKFKAFVELTICSSIRSGTQGLLATAGLGGMKPNTLALGFLSPELPRSTLQNLRQRLLKKPKFIRYAIKDTSLEKYDRVMAHLPQLRSSRAEQCMTSADYVGMVQDAITMGKNVLIMRHFERFTKKQLSTQPFIDVWPLKVHYTDGFDHTFMLLLQLSCVLHMKQDWKTSTKIRIFVLIDNDAKAEQDILQEFLRETRITALLQMVSPPATFGNSSSSSSASYSASYSQRMDFHREINGLMQQHSNMASVIFTALPPVPPDIALASKFVDEMDILSANLPPTVMVFGNMPVMAANL